MAPHPSEPCSAHAHALCFECYRAARARARTALAVLANPEASARDVAESADDADDVCGGTGALDEALAGRGLFIVAPHPTLTDQQREHRRRMLAHLGAQLGTAKFPVRDPGSLSSDPLISCLDQGSHR